MHKLAEELSKKQNVVKQNAVKQNVVKQNAVKQNAIKQNAIKQNVVKQNVVKQNVVKQNVSNSIDTLSIGADKQSDNNDDFDLTDTISGIINNELNNAN